METIQLEMKNARINEEQSPTTYCDLLGVCCGQMDDVGHLFEELPGFVQQLQNVSSVERLGWEEKKTVLKRKTKSIP